MPTLEALNDGREARLSALRSSLEQFATGPDLEVGRRVACKALRDYALAYDGLPASVQALACQRLMLSETQLTTAMNAPEILTQHLCATGQWTPPVQRVFRLLHERPEGLSRSELVDLARHTVGAKAEVDAALTPLLEEGLVRCRRRGRAGWYEVVRV